MVYITGHWITMKKTKKQKKENKEELKKRKQKNLNAEGSGCIITKYAPTNLNL